jgi:hypothetical protein
LLLFQTDFSELAAIRLFRFGIIIVCFKQTLLVSLL